tara:strand:+ start:450 stop:656 length:207 start_codon:yes stop_codon:yes gene_type:complete
MSAELKKRTLVKTMTWRVIASLTTFLIAWILTGDLLIGVSIGSIEALAKILLYYYHERIWNNINWAKD